MVRLVSGTSAALTAIIIGSLIGSVSNAARATEFVKASDAQAQAAAAAAADQQTAAALAAYHDRLGEAMTKLDAAYRELATRDASFRSALSQSEQNAASLAAANQALAARIAALQAQLQQMQQAPTTPTLSSGTTSHYHDDD